MALIRDIYLSPDYHLPINAAYKASSKLANSALYYGVELELEGCKHTLPSSGGTHVVGETALAHNITAHHDGSLRNGGIELVTKPCRGADLVDQVQYICGLAGAMGWKTSNRAGLHVHANMQDLTPEQVLNLVQLYILLEPCFFDAAGPERKGSIYCKSWYQHGDTVDLRETLGLIAKYQWSKLPSRYFGFNINSLAKYGTVEFRHMNSTTNVDDILRWINIIGKWYNYGVGNPLTEIKIKGLTPDALLYEVFGNLNLMGPEYPSYFYHGCVPLWFELFGNEVKPKLDWTKKKRVSHKGYDSFVSKRKSQPAVVPKPTKVPVSDNWTTTYTTQAANQYLVLDDPEQTPLPQYTLSNNVGVYYTVPPYDAARLRPSWMTPAQSVDGRLWLSMEEGGRKDLYRALANGTDISHGSGAWVYRYALAN